MKKIFNHFAEAVQEIKNGMTIMADGFGLVGIPKNLLSALSKTNVKNLIVISNI
ncbi:CoA-transferase [Pseudogracilibacillus auburnensis]|uniref:Coenzyme A transferase n=1 Tax=Pseudogracilibacillus auburnensis TaxID=1494959 RepID=A0A2V3VNJ2_9BACI|nr:coenzyme A transferase [Pseudogracilibacillus auburnensis]